MDIASLILYAFLFIYFVLAPLYITFGLPDSRAARRYVDEYFILKKELDDTNNKFGGITEHQYQLAIDHNKKTLPDTWIINFLWGIDDQYQIDLSKYKIIKVKIEDR